MTKPEEVRCECWAHCAIARRQERERAAKIAEDFRTRVLKEGRSIEDSTLLMQTYREAMKDVAKRIREGT